MYKYIYIYIKHIHSEVKDEKKCVYKDTSFNDQGYYANQVAPNGILGHDWVMSNMSGVITAMSGVIYIFQSSRMNGKK